MMSRLTFALPFFQKIRLFCTLFYYFFLHLLSEVGSVLSYLFLSFGICVRAICFGFVYFCLDPTQTGRRALFSSLSNSTVERGLVFVAKPEIKIGKANRLHFSNFLSNKSERRTQKKKKKKKKNHHQPNRSFFRCRCSFPRPPFWYTHHAFFSSIESIRI